jgi:predicted RNase H-like nuclease (RuvC/YqgF family)
MNTTTRAKMDATIKHINQKEKPKREGFKWGQELLKAKAIIADLYQTIVGKDKKIEELEAEIAMLRDFQGDLNADIENLKEEIEEINRATCDYKYLSDQYDIQNMVYQMNGELKAENEELKAEIAMLKRDYKLVKKIKSPFVDN